MRLGLVIQNNGAPAPALARTMPRCAEELGYDSIWVTDHVVGVRAFRPVYGATWMEAFTTLAHAAASTSRVRLGLGVLVVPYRDPVLTARMITTLDHLSQGRVDVGVGTGWSRAEFHALGRGHLFDARGEVTNESLDLMLRCWQGGEFEWRGSGFDLRKMAFDPVPYQRPHPPLWIGSRSGRGAAMRRVAKYADVWHPTGLSPDELREAGDRLDALAGRPIRRSIRLSVAPGTSTSRLVEELAAYRAAGCEEAAVDLGGPDAALARDDASARILAAAQELAAQRDAIVG